MLPTAREKIVLGIFGDTDLLWLLLAGANELTVNGTIFFRDGWNPASNWPIDRGRFLQPA
jgi:hypothetical protein